MTATTQHTISVTINGRPTELRVSPNLSLLELLRTEAGAPEVKLGCGEGVCGTCTVLLDGEPVNSCLMFAVQADGREVTTVEDYAFYIDWMIDAHERLRQAVNAVLRSGEPPDEPFDRR